VAGARTWGFDQPWNSYEALGLTCRCNRRTHHLSSSHPDVRQVRSQLNARTLGARARSRVSVRFVYRLELHDARVSAEMIGEELILHLDPAFVQHWEMDAEDIRGIGYWQAAVIRVTEAEAVSPLPNASTLLSGGWIQVGNDRYSEVIPVPLTGAGPVRGFLEQEDDFPAVFEFSGTALSVEIGGAPADPEALPAEWAPRSA
jgi:hypothetical protein